MPESTYELEFRDAFEERFQETVLALLMQDRDVLARAASVIEARYFTAGVYRAVAGALLTFWAAEHVLPQRATLAAAASKAGESAPEREAIAAFVDRLYAEAVQPLDKKFVTQELLHFVQRAQAAVAVGKAYNDLKRFPIETLATELDRIRRLPALWADQGMRLDRDWATVLEQDYRPYFLTGFRGIDHAMRGAVRAGELVSFMGVVGRGKTLTLTNIGRGLFATGHHVVHYTLEVHREDVLRAYWAAIAKAPVRDLHEHAEAIQEQLQGFASYTQGSVTIQRFAAMEASVAVLEAHHEMLTQMTGKKVIPIVDYAALLKPPEEVADREWAALQGIFDALRNWAERAGVPVFTANQTNVGGFTAKELGLQHQSMSTRASFSADYMWGINMSPLDDAVGRMRLSPFKNRNEQTHQSVFLKYDKPCRRLDEITKAEYVALAAGQEDEGLMKRTSRGRSAIELSGVMA